MNGWTRRRIVTPIVVNGVPRRGCSTLPGLAVCVERSRRCVSASAGA